MLTIADLYQLAEGLHPLELDDGLDAALAALAGRSSVPVDLDVRVAGLPSNDVTVAAYYVCAEALANVAKHSGATSVQVRVERRREELTVVVDNGAGGAEPAKGSGLRGVTDRVEALDGTLTVTSPTGAGTRLTAEPPLGRPSL